MPDRGADYADESDDDLSSEDRAARKRIKDARAKSRRRRGGSPPRRQIAKVPSPPSSEGEGEDGTGADERGRNEPGAPSPYKHFPHRNFELHRLQVSGGSRQQQSVYPSSNRPAFLQFRQNYAGSHVAPSSFANHPEGTGGTGSQGTSETGLLGQRQIRNTNATESSHATKSINFMKEPISEEEEGSPNMELIRRESSTLRSLSHTSQASRNPRHSHSFHARNVAMLALSDEERENGLGV